MRMCMRVCVCGFCVGIGSYFVSRLPLVWRTRAVQLAVVS